MYEPIGKLHLGKVWDLFAIFTDGNKPDPQLDSFPNFAENEREIWFRLRYLSLYDLVTSRTLYICSAGDAGLK